VTDPFSTARSAIDQAAAIHQTDQQSIANYQQAVATKDRQLADLQAQHAADQKTIATLRAELADATGPAWGVNIGTNVGKLTQVDAEMGGIDSARFYWGQKAKGTKATCRYPTATDLGGNLGSRILVASYKLWPQDILAGMYDADITATAKAAPTGQVTMLGLWHEFEDDIEKGHFTAQQMNDAQQRWASLIHAVGNPQVLVALILMGFTYNGGKSRDWRTFYPGDASVDVMCTDEYAWAPNNPKDLTTIFAKGRAAADSVGKPFSVTETGVDPATFGNGQARYDALKLVAQRARAVSNGPVAMYFGADPGDRWDLVTDPNALAAWKAGQTG
jgi:beta-mannanase